jgi:hypothetical protein
MELVRDKAKSTSISGPRCKTVFEPAQVATPWRMVHSVDAGRPQFQSHQGYLRQTCPTAWDTFTKCVDLRDSKLEQTILDKAISIRMSESHHQTSNFRYTWGDFEALSYTWGDGGDARTILVNGTRRDVSKES